jgi:hypothetical protein
MAQVITLAGERLFALKAQNNEALDIDTFIFAKVPGQDSSAPIDRNEGLPPLNQRVHQQAVQQVGMINENVVVYSSVLDSLTGPFDFNWVGLYSSTNQTLIAISHIPTATKTVTAPGAAGNLLNRNFAIEYSGIAELTGITVNKDSWQIDQNARLNGMDELTRKLAADMNGKDWFIEDGFKVVPRSTLNTFKVTTGAGYVSGLRVELAAEQILTVSSYPKFVYVDAWFDGTSESVWKGHTAFTVTNSEMDDYIDVNGKQHYVFKLARITASDAVEDLRTTEGLAEKMANVASKSSELEYRTDGIELSIVSPSKVKENGIFNGKKCTSIISDSIGHGAYAGDLFANGWTRLLARSLNGEYDSASYGFTPYLSLGTGENVSRDIHNVSFVGAWAAIFDNDNNCLISGVGHRSNGANSEIKFSLPTFMRRSVIYYVEQPGGGKFDIFMNGVLSKTVDTNAVATALNYVEVAMIDNRYGSCEIKLVTIDNNTVDFAGISYLSSVLETVCNNFSRSGRRLRYVSEYCIKVMCENSHTLLMALGHNDYGETSQDYIDETKKRIDWFIQYAKANNVHIFVPDFCWSAPLDNWMRKELIRLAQETKGKYINLPKLLMMPNGSEPDANHLINNLKMWVDGSHPNAAGNKWVFENIAKSMGLSCSSKSQALNLHDYAIPLALDASVEVKNALLAGQLSTVKRSGNSLLINCYLEKDSGGQFPIGDYIISQSFPIRTNIVGQQNTVFPLMKLDGSSVIGGCAISASGQMSLKITQATVYNDLIFQAQLMK